MPRRAALLAPILVALSTMFSLYAAHAVHWSAMLRPGGFVIIGAALLTVAVWVVVRRPVTTSAIACLLVGLLFQQQALVLIIAGLMLGVIGVRIAGQSRGRRPGSVPASYVLAPSGLLFAFSAGGLVTTGAITSDDFRIHAPASAVASAARGLPNIYVLLLDGYPRGDTLAEMGYDNEPFLTALERRGLVVDRQSTTQFRRTELTLSAMASEQDHQPSEVGDPVSHRREARRHHLVNRPVMDAFRALGYRMIYIPSPVLHVEWSGWDERIDSGHLTDFESTLLHTTPLRHPLGTWVMDQQRQRVDHALAAWSSRPAGQQFMFAHLMVPHPPFLWGEDGDSKPLRCWYEGRCGLYHARAVELGLTEAEYVALLRPQIKETNARVLAGLDSLLSADPDAVVVVFSDHGLRHSDVPTAEWHHNLLAAHPPLMRVEGMFGQLLEAVTPMDGH